MSQYILESSATSNGNYPGNSGISWTSVDGDNNNLRSGTFAVTGTYGAATITLQVSWDSGTTWQAVGSDTTLTAVGQGNFSLGGPCRLRANVASVSGDDLHISIVDGRSN